MQQKRKSNKTLEKLYKQRGSCCHYCENKVEFSYITRDHIKPKVKGFKIPDNWVFSCSSCNGKKGSLMPEEFVNLMVKNIVDILRKIKLANFVATQSQVDKIRHYHKLMMNTKKLI